MSMIAIKVFAGQGRLPDQPEVTCQPFAGRSDQFWAADVLSVENTGLRLASGRRFEPGTVLLVRVRTAGDSTFRQLAARVFTVTGPLDGKWVMDCELASQPDEAWLASLRRAKRAGVP